MIKKSIELVPDSESIQIFRESLIASIEQLLEEDKSGVITASTILQLLKTGEL